MGKHIKCDQMIVYSILLFLLGLVLFLIGYRQYPAGQRAYVILATTSLMLLSVCLFVETVFMNKKKNEYSPKINFNLKRVGIVLGTSVLYVCFMSFLGFILSTLLFIMICAWILGYHKPTVILLIAVGCTAILYIGFQIGLGVPLPAGVLLGK